MFQNISTKRESRPFPAHFGKHEKKPFGVIYHLYKMKQSHA